ncbi:MAG: DEAD/DEAH box helicase [Bacteroidales bacterium]
MKDQKGILDKLQIGKLTPMQEEAHEAISSGSDVVLLSPTGSGKTLAYLLPIIEKLSRTSAEVQVLILVPSRELAMQIEQVTREMGTGFKANAVYGGRAGSQDKLDLQHRPAILIGTPGRVADTLRKGRFSPQTVTTLILDEFDKSLQVGFEVEMEEILSSLPKVKQRILTSATQSVRIPEFVGMRKPLYVNYQKEGVEQLDVKIILSPLKDKLQTLVKALCHLGDKPGILFCNYKESIQRVSDYLTEIGIAHGCFHGDMEQIDRERTLVQFRNGTLRLIVATDLAARGLDIPEIKFIMHYQLPGREHEFIHRNGRTARMKSDGTAYILQWADEELPQYVKGVGVEKLTEAPLPPVSEWATLYLTGGRRDKISKGDIAGLFIKQGNITSDDLGIIEIKQDCSFVAVKASMATRLVDTLNNSKLKTKKIRVSAME